jgi:hypothetical protein
VSDASRFTAAKVLGYYSDMETVAFRALELGVTEAEFIKVATEAMRHAIESVERMAERS